MTSREIILANITHNNPTRPGFNFSGARMNDMWGAGLCASNRFKPTKWTENGMEYYDDEWGNIWCRMMDGCASGEIFKPALDDWRKLDTLVMPDFDDPKRFEGARKEFQKPGDKFKIFFIPGWVFATSRYLRKMEIYFVDLIEYREEIDRLHNMVTDLLIRVIHLAADAGTDAIFYCEDLGIQDRPLIGPAMWRDVFRSHYLRLVGAAHERGLKVLMHSCGYNWELIDELASTGIDCFQFDQPAAYDMPALAAKLRQYKIGLWSPIDIQKVMPTGNRELIEIEASRMVNNFKGGLILKNYPDLPGIGVKPEWDQWGYEALIKAAGL